MDLTCEEDDSAHSYACDGDDDSAHLHQCHICSKTFNRISKLKRHTNKIHDGGRKKLKKTKILKQKLLNKKDRQHQRLLSVLEFERKVLKPVGQNGVRCYLCLKNYSSKETVDKHLVTFFVILCQGDFFV